MKRKQPTGARKRKKPCKKIKRITKDTDSCNHCKQTYLRCGFDGCTKKFCNEEYDNFDQDKGCKYMSQWQCYKCKSWFCDNCSWEFNFDGDCGKCMLNGWLIDRHSIDDREGSILSIFKKQFELTDDMIKDAFYQHWSPTKGHAKKWSVKEVIVDKRIRK